MTAPTGHRCAYVLYVAGRWVCASRCHWGQTVTRPLPGFKPGWLTVGRAS